MMIAQREGIGDHIAVFDAIAIHGFSDLQETLHPNDRCHSV